MHPLIAGIYLHGNPADLKEQALEETSNSTSFGHRFPRRTTETLAALFAGLTAATFPAHAATSRMLDIPPRQQWEANHGYCGEVSLISAGLYFGQYMSQYDVRSVASPGKDQSRQDSQLLLGVNDEAAAQRLHLKATVWKARPSGTEDFLAWVKKNTLSGYPVTIGVYYNQASFEDDGDPSAGNREYDHIVPVVGVSSAGTAAYSPDDVLIFSDNGFWAPNGSPKFVYRYGFEDVQATRQEANSDEHPEYSIASSGENYGIAITGVVDHDHQTLPVRLKVSSNREAPAIKQGSNERPAANSITVTATVSGLKPGISYKLYRYDDLSDVPDESFNGNADNASKEWTISITQGSSYTVKEEISSADTAVYRAVPVSAP